ncbi:DNA-binding protein [Aureimonas altamirensis]|uniref:PPC domain-containing DNA-binding protein n=1 Tax=Aureimonas altamirensis TaxID=370622 RepID=UPI0020368612|nr:PPC domain-containing DNA-binding protein [Aureimonas altamirensis]MCM2503146.1 DNA-binding protein [Aureimonas altamirensis]
MLDDAKRHFDSAAGTTGRVVAARIHPDRDLLESVEEVCRAHDISCGVITTSIGSFRRLAMHYVDRVEPTKEEGYTRQLVLEGPFSLIAGQGIVAPSLQPGRLDIHYHCVASGKDNRFYGGHVEPGTITLTTLDLVIQEIHGIDIVRGRDPQTGVIVTTISEKENVR